ncbi:MAG: MBL fold metallo-hydrolase [Syntrophaceae bacterium]|nr:MBL fold metallo-hydrolase [Syntrophaceae bacterium]
MKIRFWGVRGSIPCPGPATVKYGGNTPCIELRLEDSRRTVIIDAGSGIRDLGNLMMVRDLPEGPIRADLFLTHTHWDHIMGFPFFTPVYVPGTKLNIYGPATYEEETMRDVMGGQMAYRYFPVRWTDLAADIRYFDLKEERIDLGGGLLVSSIYLNHPVLSLGYRFERAGAVLCTVFDTEPFRNIFSTDPLDSSYSEEMAAEGEAVAKEQNERLEAFFHGADFLIHDAQYTGEEYSQGKTGWGHSPMEHAIQTAGRAGVKRLALFHHDPMRTDAELDALAVTLCTPGTAESPEVVFAREGMEIDIGRCA